MGFESYMHLALEEARAAASRGEVPVGAVLIGPGRKVLARDGNRSRELSDPTAHAETAGHSRRNDRASAPNA